MQGAAVLVAAGGELEALLVGLRAVYLAPHAALVKGDEADEVRRLNRLLRHRTVGDLAGDVDAPQPFHPVDVGEALVAGRVAEPGISPGPLRAVVHDAVETERELHDVGGDLGGGVQVGQRAAVVDNDHDLTLRRHVHNVVVEVGHGVGGAGAKVGVDEPLAAGRDEEVDVAVALATLLLGLLLGDEEEPLSVFELFRAAEEDVSVDLALEEVVGAEDGGAVVRLQPLDVERGFGTLVVKVEGLNVRLETKIAVHLRLNKS